GTLFHGARRVGPEGLRPSRCKDRPVIRLSRGNHPEAVSAGIAALAGAAFFQRQGKLVYVQRQPAKSSDGSVVLIPSIVEVPIPYLQNELGKWAVWRSYDGRRKRWVQVDVPRDIAARIAAMPNDWTAPPIRGVISTPTMRPDGTLLTTPGYDHRTGFVLFEPPTLPVMPHSPSREDAFAALRLLYVLL